MDLSTTYLGLKLRSPLVPSASPLSESLDDIRLMEDSGAAAVVLYSLFEEQLRLETHELHHHLTSHTESFAEALTFFPEADQYRLGPEDYLKHIANAKKAVRIPIIASLNCATAGGWVDFAKRIEEAGADALELNIYNIPTDMDLEPEKIEGEYLAIVRAIKEQLKIPVAVKLAPYFSNLANMAKKIDEAGADGLVLFNRFYQPDIDIEKMEVRSDVFLSSPQTLRLPLRWIGILYHRIRADLAATGGIQGAADVIKMLMVGANVTMLCAILLRKGIRHIKVIEDDLVKWLGERGYESVREMRGAMSQIHCDNPSAYERAQYIRAITSYRPEQGRE